MFIHYPVFIQNNKESGAIISDFSVVIPDLRGCSCSGITLEEALQQAKEVVKRHLEELSLKNKTFPKPTQDYTRLSKKPEFKSGIWHLIEIDPNELKINIPEVQKKSTTVPRDDPKKIEKVKDDRAHEILIGKQEFLLLLPEAKKWKGTWKNNDARMGLSLEEEGVYVVPFPKGEWEYEGMITFREFMDHSEKELGLRFPCTIDQFESFFLLAGLGAPCTQEKLEEFKLKYLKEYESDKDRVERLKKEGMPDKEITAHIMRRNPNISNHGLGTLLPSKYYTSSNYPEKREKERGRTLKKKVRKDERLAKIAGVSVKK